MTAKIFLKKKDAETNKAEPQGDATLEKAVYGLYAREDIVHPDGATGVIYKAGDKVASLTTNEKGEAVAENLYLGKYFVKEITPPTGYLTDKNEYDLVCDYEGDLVAVVERSCTSLEQVKKQPFQIIKAANNGNTDAALLEGAGFTAYLVSSLTVKEDGTYDFDSVTPVVLGENGATEIFTDKKGYAVSIPLPYGTYVVRETTTPHNYKPVDDFIVRITEHKPTEPQVWRVSWNDMVAGAMDSIWGYVTGSLKDVTFEIYAREDIKAADGESDDYYKKDELVATIKTDELGIARTDDLPLGKYYVVEKETADGFVLDGEPRDIDLTYRDQDTPVVTFDSEWQNSRQKAKVIVTKKEKDSDRVLEGGVFALCAKEDIKNTDGDVLVKADTIMEQKATDKDGKIFFTADLPVGGSFYVKEVKAPAGFVTTEEVKEFTFEYAGADVPEVTFEHTFENEATIFEITKSDLTTGEELPGAKLEVTDQDGTVVDEWTSGTEPHIIKELEVGKEYTLTETLPADGYVTAESITFTVENTAEVQKVEMKDDVTKVEISKTDISGKELPGAKMTVLDKDGNAVESWTSTDKPHYMEKLPIGDYILREETAPEGYLIAEDVEFSVKDTGEIQKVSMKDEKKPSETPQTPQEPSKPTDTPKTGDDSNIRLWLLLAGLALCGTGGSLFLLKKKK